MDNISLLALGVTLDEICKDNDIEPEFVINYLLDEGLIDLKLYFSEEQLNEAT